MRALLIAGAVVSVVGCHNFDEAYADCVARGACPGGVSGSAGGQVGGGSGGGNVTGGGAVGGGSTAGGAAGGSSTSQLRVDPAGIVVESVPSETLVTTFSIWNVGSTTLTQVTVNPPTEAHFTIRSTDCSGAQLAPDASCTAAINYLPTDLTTTTGVFRVTTANGTLDEIALSGQGVVPLTVSPSRLDFGTVNIGDVPPLQPITLTNHSFLSATAPLRFSGSHAAFDAGTCATPIPSRGSCEAAVAFAPTASVDSGTLVVSGANDGGARPAERATVDLSGRGIPPAAFTFTPSSFALATDYGQPPVQQAFTLRNSSNVEATGPMTLGLVDDAGLFALDAGTCVASGLAALAQCQGSVTFLASRPGVFNAQLFASLADGGSRFAPVAGTAYDFVPVRVVVAMPDSGVVLFRDGGTACASGCVFGARRGVSDFFTAQPANNGVFVRWDGGCFVNGTTPQLCSFTPTTDGGITIGATFGPQVFPLTVTGVAPDAGRVTSVPSGLDCPGTCTANFPWYSDVIIFAAGTQGRTLQALTGACDGGVTCQVSMNAARIVNVAWKAGRVNLAFVGPTSILAGTGLAALDARCTQAADAGGLPTQSWKALLSTSTQVAFDRLVSDAGWQSVRGDPIALSVRQLREGRLLSPIIHEASGFRRGTAQVLTGMLIDGGVGETCGDWSGSTAYATGAWLDVSGPAWFGGIRDFCNVDRAYFCIQDDPTGIAPTVQQPSRVRLVFTSRGTVDGLTSDAQADALCSGEAADAGLPSAPLFSAYRRAAVTGGPWVFDPNGPPFYRVDGLPLWVQPSTLSPTLADSIPVNAANVDARGAFVEGFHWMYGCNDWQSNQTTTTGSARRVENITWRVELGPACSQQGHLLCVQR